MSVAISLLALTPLLSTAPQDDPGFKQPAVLEGRFLLPDGTPAEDVKLSVRGWGANQDRTLEFGEPKNWTSPTGDTDEDGRFRIQFVPPRAYQFVLEANLEGYAVASWRWSEIALGETKNLGDTTLVPVGTVVGRIADQDGNTLTKGWRVTAETPRTGRGIGGRTQTRVGAFIDPASGEFRLEGVPAGRVVISGRNGGGVDTNEVTVEVVPGIEALVELVYAGPNLDRRITVVYFSRPFYTFGPASESISLIAADGTERTAVHVQGSSQSEAFDDLLDGVYRVEIDDPLYEFWSRDGVRPGERVDARLKGSASLELEVVDGETGRAISRYGLRVVFHESNTSPNEFELLPDGSDPPAKGIFEGVIPGNLQLIVRAEGRPLQRFPVEGLTRGERRVMRIELGRGARLVGRVLDAAGGRIAGAKVQRTPGAVAGLPKGMMSSGPDGRIPNLEETYETDGDGRFVVTDVAAGVQTFRVSASPWLTVDRTVELPLADGEELEIQAPPSGWLEGQLILPEGASTEGLSLAFTGQGIEDSTRFPFLREGEGGSVAADGTFRYGPLPTGKLAVNANFSISLGGGSSTWLQQPLGPVTIEPGSTARESWDLTETFPGSASVTLWVDGDKLADVGLSFGQERNGRSGSSGHLEPNAGGQRVRTGLEPGTWYVGVIGAGHAWQWSSPDPVLIEAGCTTDVELKLDLIRRGVRFLDAETGDPCASTEVVAWTGTRGWMASSTRATTDEGGTLEFQLPSGEVRFCRPQPNLEPPDPRRGRFRRETEPPDSVVVEWNNADDELVVRLPRREE